VLRLLTERMGELSDRLRELATERVARRVARALLRLARTAGRRTDRGVEIDLPLTREDIARLSGTTLFTVSRLMADWEEAGIVESGRERVTSAFPTSWSPSPRTSPRVTAALHPPGEAGCGSAARGLTRRAPRLRAAV